MGHSKEFLQQVLERDAIASLISDAKKMLAEGPNACVVVGRKQSMVQIRVGEGKRTWVSMRALMWMETHGGELLTFSPPSCGTAGCVNPAHQTQREPQPRIKVMANVAA